MQKLDVRLPPAEDSSQNCPIWIGAGILESLPSLFDLAPYSKICVLADDNTAPLWADKFLRAIAPRSVSLVTIPAGEARKTPDTAAKLWRHFAAAGLDRKSLLLNLGGGVIGDMGGFAAGTYMRGIDFVQLPTTLIAQADAAIGGKVGLNFDGVKNLVGLFNRPRAILADIATLSTLPERQYRSGFAELIKHGLINDAAYFDWLWSSEKSDLNQTDLIKAITRSCEIKIAAVCSDELESGPRRVLNFGHTIGHALEALSLESDEPLLHGEAVSIGLAVEAKISMLKGMLSLPELKAIEMALTKFSLPIRPRRPLNVEAVLAKISLDKKAIGGRVNWTLLERIGQAAYNQEVESALICEALK